MASSALPSAALYDVQKYLRQKRATGAQVTPQNERAAWSGYFDTIAANNMNEQNMALQQERLDLLKDQQKAEEGAATISGAGQLLTTVGVGAMALKGTEIGAKIGLGGPAATSPVTSGAAPTTAAGTVGGGSVLAGGGSAAGLAGPEATAIAAGGSGGPAAGGMLAASAPYAGPAGVGLAAGMTVPHMLGFNKGVGEKAAGAAAGAATGAAAGAALTSWSGPGAAVGAVIGAVAGGVGASIK